VLTAATSESPAGLRPIGSSACGFSFSLAVKTNVQTHKRKKTTRPNRKRRNAETLMPSHNPLASRGGVG